MAQWIVETTTVPARKDTEGDWDEKSAHGRKADAMKAAHKLRKSSPPKVRVRTRIDYSRGGMAG